MNKKLIKYFTRRKKERAREQSRRLGDAGMLIGAVIGAEHGEDEFDVAVGAFAGLLIAGLFEELCPKTASIVKAIL